MRSTSDMVELFDDSSVDLIAVAVRLHVQLAFPNGDERLKPLIARIGCIEVYGGRRDPLIRIRPVEPHEEAHGVKSDRSAVVRLDDPSQIRSAQGFALLFEEVLTDGTADRWAFHRAIATAQVFPYRTFRRGDWRHAWPIL